MNIMTDSGASLQITPTITKPLPPSTPEVQAVPAAGFTPAQVQTMIQNPPPPPLTPVHNVPAYIPEPAAAPAGPGPGEVTPFRGLAGVEEAGYRPAGVVWYWQTIVSMLKTNVPRVHAACGSELDSAMMIMR